MPSVSDMLSVLVIGIILLAVVSAAPSAYQTDRNNFIAEELAMRVGAKLTLSSEENLVNEFLMTLKNETIQKSIWTTTPYPPAISFFKNKPWIDNSTIFDVLRMMPKGGVLHLHDVAMTSLDWVVKNFSHQANLYTRMEPGIYPTRKFTFSDTNPGGGMIGSPWRLRNSASSVDEFENSMIYNLSIWVEDPFIAYPSINDVWGKFETYFTSMRDLFSTPENNRLYFKQGLQEFYDDGVQYIEIRSVVMAEGSITEDYLLVMKSVIDEFKKDHPDFIGAKIILSSLRMLPNQADVVKKAIELIRKYPDFIMGFDLLQQEDVTHWTVEYENDLLENGQSRLPYFFHAGETDWTQWVDYNLVDSVLVNASRIADAYAVIHHPKVMKAILKKDIAIEINPISNQVLGLVNDLRNHPGAYLIAKGAPVVIGSDDPPVWLASPLSHDFYMTFMGLGAVHDDLRLLKQLAKNSITYSTMTEDEKMVARMKWRRRWDKFIADVISKYNLRP